jgi:hypothetical protein
LTNYLRTLLSQRGIKLDTMQQIQDAKGMKERTGYVAWDFNADMSAATPAMSYTLSSGQVCCE